MFVEKRALETNLKVCHLQSFEICHENNPWSPKACWRDLSQKSIYINKNKFWKSLYQKTVFSWKIKNEQLFFTPFFSCFHNNAVRKKKKKEIDNENTKFVDFALQKISVIERLYEQKCILLILIQSIVKHLKSKYTN